LAYHGLHPQPGIKDNTIMLAVISPAKTLDYDTPAVTDQCSQPEHLDPAGQLIEQLRTLDPVQLANLMHISDKLAALNLARYQAWHTPFTPDNARQAVLAFKGDVYTGLDAYSMNPQNFVFAQTHLRILSGLYGLLRPLDLMQPYRLEMGTRLANTRGRDLYAFWGDTITLSINKALEETPGSKVLVNLASQEYFSSVRPAALASGTRILTPVFRDWKNGQYKIISFHAKKARGMMVRYIIDHGLTTEDDLVAFDYGGYSYRDDMSDDSQWVFVRGG